VCTLLLVGCTNLVTTSIALRIFKIFYLYSMGLFAFLKIYVNYIYITQNRLLYSILLIFGVLKYKLQMIRLIWFLFFSLSTNTWKEILIYCYLSGYFRHVTDSIYIFDLNFCVFLYVLFLCLHWIILIRTYSYMHYWGNKLVEMHTIRTFFFVTQLVNVVRFFY